MIRCIKTESSALIKFSGEPIIGTSNTGILEKKVNKLVKQKAGIIAISLEGINFIDSTGFRVLMRLNENSRFEGTEIILSDISDELMELFVLLKLDKKFKTEKNNSQYTRR